jgi:hypothetical protein
MEDDKQNITYTSSNSSMSQEEIINLHPNIVADKKEQAQSTNSITITDQEISKIDYTARQILYEPMEDTEQNNENVDTQNDKLKRNILRLEYKISELVTQIDDLKNGKTKLIQLFNKSVNQLNRYLCSRNTKRTFNISNQRQKQIKQT